MGDGNLRECGKPLLQVGGHLVGVGGCADAVVVGKVGDELRADEPHLGGELHRLLAQVLKPVGQIGIVEDNCLAKHHPVLGAAKRDDINP